MTFRTCHLINTAWVYAPERVILRGGTNERLRLTVTVALLEHPTEGWGLFDTGSGPRIDEASRRWPLWLYPRVVRSYPSADGAAVDALPTFGLTSADIRWIVISHFHPDHTGGLRDFPRATLYATGRGYDFAASLRGWSALRHAVLPGLLPDDAASRLTRIEAFRGPDAGALGGTHDLFEDGSARLVSLPGHARGQVGMLVRLRDREILLAADGSYLSRAIRENRPPSRVTALFADDYDAGTRTVAALHAFARAHPDVAIIPAHCPEAFERWGRR